MTNAGLNAGPIFIDADTVRRLTPMPSLIAALADAFSQPIDLPPRQVHDLSGGNSLLLMPAWRTGGDAGVKVVTIYPDARPSVKGAYLLLDGQVGGPRAILDGTMLTLRRTAAVSAMVSDRMARRDTRTMLMVGTGALAPHLVEAHASVRPFERILIWGRDRAKSQALAADLAQSGFPAVAADDLDSAVGEADLISAATLSTAPLIRGARLKPGTHLDLVGAYLPDMVEADPDCFRDALVCVDLRASALAEAGDVIQAIAAGALDAGDIAADLHDLCSGAHPGRSAQHVTTIFKSVGLAIEDLVAAEAVYLATQKDFE